MRAPRSPNRAELALIAAALALAAGLWAMENVPGFIQWCAAAVSGFVTGVTGFHGLIQS